MTNKTEIDINLDEARSAEPEVVLSAAEEAALKTMIENHVFYGHTKSKTNPKMRANILSTKSGVEIIDLMRTMKQLEVAYTFIKEKVKSGGSVLFVGTTPATKITTKETAIRLGMPYVVERWLGGTLTNFKTISTRVNHFKKLLEDRAAGRLQKYTKKERLDIDVELAKMDKFFSGVVSMDRLPAAVVITDLGAGNIVADEARITKVPSVAFVNTNCDPDKVNFAIASNDRNSKSVVFLLAQIEKAVKDGVAARAAVAAAAAPARVEQKH